MGCAQTRVAYGSNTGAAFSDFNTTNPWPCGVDITELRIRHGHLIDSIQLTYKTVDQFIIIGPQRGGQGGRESFVRLDQGERITGVSGTVCTQTRDFPGTGVRQLIFFSRKADGQRVLYGPYGKVSQPQFPAACRMFAVNGKINSIYGRVVAFRHDVTGLGAIGFYYEDESRVSQNAI